MKNVKIWFDNILKVDTVYKICILNNFQIPAIKSITLNVCSQAIMEDSKAVLYAIIAIKLITNQNPQIYRAKKSIAALKLRKGAVIGTKITLQGQAIYNFLNLFIFIILPNLKDFRPSKINGSGSLSIIISNLLIFPQLNSYFDKFPKYNMESVVNINVSKSNSKISSVLFTGLQLPIKSIYQYT